MPRNHSRSSARPAQTTRPVQTAPPKRQAHTTTAAAAPSLSQPVAAAPPQPTYIPQPSQGILGQIATTAAGVATGHVIGRMVTGLFTGNSLSENGTATNEMAASTTNSSPHDLTSANFINPARTTAPQCQEYSKLFLQCMEQNGNQVNTCQDYLEMMKACQQQYA